MKQRLLVVLVVALGVTAFLAYRTQALPEGFVRGTFGDVSLRIELATTSAVQQKGLGGRESIPSDYGMLFVFPKSDMYGIWMLDTLAPLDIFWLDANGHVVSIAEEVQPASYPHVFYPATPARYVLETAAGFARKHDVATGTPLVLPTWPSVLE